MPESMAAFRVDVGSRFLVWVVAGLAAGELLLNTVAAFFNRDWSDFLVFGFGGVGFYVAALLLVLERLKIPGEE